MRYLTKSKFKLARECPTKLFYLNKKEYPNISAEDPFLSALAEGGFQVGELAKLYHEGGHEIRTLDYEGAIKQTNELLKKENIILFEPAIKFENLFIRVDILIKTGNHFDLIEVKAKSIDSSAERPFTKKNGKPKSEWSAYLEDISFQKYVLMKAFPLASVNCSLMLADKDAKCQTDGLNQKFKISKNKNNQKEVIVSNSLMKEDLKVKLLKKINVDEIVSDILSDDEFISSIDRLSKAYCENHKIDSPVGTKCSGCEFKCSEEQEAQGFKSGFKECWSYQKNFSEGDFKKPTIFDIWNYRGKSKLLDSGIIFLDDVKQDDINPSPDGGSGLSPSERQWLQIEKSKSGDMAPFFDKENLKAEMQNWKFPLHFIDFETTMVAIPFNKGRSPYEGVAFQFSHHKVYEDGTVEHAGEFLNTETGKFPNYEFVRALKKELEADNGSIFKYSPHENTFLNHIYGQLKEDYDVLDREELCRFIKEITHSTSHSDEKWIGERDMIDLWDLVKRYFYDPHTNGSNSIKAVLPAVLGSSEYLQSKYSKPIYGSENGIKSMNFKDKVWLVKEDGKIIDPYKSLPKMFQDTTDVYYERLTESDDLNNGGAALTAYGRLQFSEMSNLERNELEKALLRYCELDTLAMVMIYEAWREWL